MTGPHNKALHQTRRRGVPASRAVVEGRLAGEGWCCTDRRTDRKILVPPPSAVAEAHPCYRAQTAPAWKALIRPFSGVGLLSGPARPSSNIMSTAARPPRFHRHPHGSTSVINRLALRITIGTSRLGGARPHNNALQLTRGASEASGLRRTRHSLVPLAAERECCAGDCGEWRNEFARPRAVRGPGTR